MKKRSMYPAGIELTPAEKFWMNPEKLLGMDRMDLRRKLLNWMWPLCSLVLAIVGLAAFWIINARSANSFPINHPHDGSFMLICGAIVFCAVIGGLVFADCVEPSTIRAFPYCSHCDKVLRHDQFDFRLGESRDVVDETSMGRMTRRVHDTSTMCHTCLKPVTYNY